MSDTVPVGSYQWIEAFLSCDVDKELPLIIGIAPEGHYVILNFMLNDKHTLCVRVLCENLVRSKPISGNRWINAFGKLPPYRATTRRPSYINIYILTK